MRNWLVRGILVFMAACASTAAPAALVTEYFNNYGTATASLTGKGAATGGWSGAWQGPTSVQYNAGAQLSYTGPEYGTPGSESDPDDGSVLGGTGATTDLLYRTFNANTFGTGTIWLSVLVRYDSIGDDILFWIDKNNSTVNGGDREFLGLRGSAGTSGTSSPPEAVIAYNGTDDTSSTIDFAINTTHLFLAKIDMNVGGVNDSISWWIDPDLSGGAAGLGTTVGSANGPVYVKSGSDAYGTAFDGVAFSSNGNTSGGVGIDSIRISNDADGFAQVTAVPEPSTWALAIFGLIGAAALRRRTN